MIRFYKVTLAVICLSITTHCFSQNTPAQQVLSKQSEYRLLNFPVATESEAQFFEKKRSLMGLSNLDELNILSNHLLSSGQAIKRYKQFHQKIEVIGATYILHINEEDKVQRATGRIAPFLKINPIPSISESKAHNIATSRIESFLNQEEAIDPFFDATWNIDNSRLIIIDKNYPDNSGHYELAYEIVLSAEYHNIPQRWFIYLDAHTGKWINHFSDIMHESVDGIAHTHYYGEQEIIIDSIAPDHYEMIDTTRGEGIITRDYYTGSAIENTVNNWNGVAGDAHYCASSYYDFMLDHFNWKGIDSNNGALVSNINQNGKYYLNAYWNGNNAAFGNGNCHEYGPLTTLDIVGHEFTHGFIDYSSDLIYKNESGALNESTADIMGKALEYYYDTNNFSWLLGERIIISPDATPFRSMSNPNDRNDPKFYGGYRWYAGSADQGGVHTNSGVLNYWFYLLCEGGQDINEADYSFEVTPIGIEKAIQMVFFLNVGYFTESTNYIEAMYFSLAYAENEYGVMSPEYDNILEAWKAVGLYPGIESRDLSIESRYPTYSVCPGDEVYMEVIVRNKGLEPFLAGEEIMLEYKQKNDVAQIESHIFSSIFNAGDSIVYQFSQPLQDSIMHNGTITIKLHVTDNITLNNTTSASSKNTNTSGTDLELSNFNFITGNICNNDVAEAINFTLKNAGCKLIPEGDSIHIEIETSNGIVKHGVALNWDFLPGNFLGQTINISSDPITIDFEEYTSRLIYPADQIESNNSKDGFITQVSKTEQGYLETFSDPIIESHYATKKTNIYVKDSIFNYKGNKMLSIVGLRSNPYFENCPELVDFFEEYNYRTKLTFCIEAGTMEEPTFSFDLIQLTNADYDLAEVSEVYGSVVEVSTDSTIYPLIYGLPEGESTNMKFDLPYGYSGLLEILILTNSGMTDPFLDDDFAEVDAALFDNFRLYDNALESAVKDIIDDQSISIFPNPTDGRFLIKHQDQNTQFTVTIYDIKGALLYKQRNITSQLEIESANWGNGIYIINVVTDDGTISSHKLVNY